MLYAHKNVEPCREDLIYYIKNKMTGHVEPDSVFFINAFLINRGGSCIFDPANGQEVRGRSMNAIKLGQLFMVRSRKSSSEAPIARVVPLLQGLSIALHVKVEKWVDHS